ncbi:hypothetical protein WN73_11865 [Bradyrhizobium sp. CCBAU 45394]|nr:hypothetical protein [Bradyrhizobium sp. CCBAU 45394]
MREPSPVSSSSRLCTDARIPTFGQIDPYICRTIHKCILIRHIDIIRHSEAVTNCDSTDYKGKLDLLLIFKAVRGNNSKRFQFKPSEFDQRFCRLYQILGARHTPRGLFSQVVQRHEEGRKLDEFGPIEVSQTRRNRHSVPVSYCRHKSYLAIKKQVRDRPPDQKSLSNIL